MALSVAHKVADFAFYDVAELAFETPFGQIFDNDRVFGHVQSHAQVTGRIGSVKVQERVAELP